MTKKKTTMNISKETFEANANRRRDIIKGLQHERVELEGIRMGIHYKILETQVRVDLGPECHKPINPAFTYETDPRYLQAQHERQQYILRNLQEQMNDNEKKTAVNNHALSEEKQRLALIEQGIPAWLDNEFRKASE